MMAIKGLMKVLFNHYNQNAKEMNSLCVIHFAPKNIGNIPN